MDFIRIARGRWPEARTAGRCYLRDDGWDDYTFRTLFDLLVVDEEGTSYEVGSVKIMRRGMTSGRVPIDDQFTELGPDYCSLGQDQNYYEQLMALPQNLGLEILASLRDAAASEAIWTEFSEEQAFGTSLMRMLNPEQVQRTFRNIVRGIAAPSPYKFTFKTRPQGDFEPLEVSVSVRPNTLPPTNVHVLIGRNGVGKTRLLAGIANALTLSDDPNAVGMPGELAFDDEDGARFANLVTVAFSAFDRFEPLSPERMGGNLRYAYVGLKRERKKGDADEAANTFKNPRDLSDEFAGSLAECLNGPRRARWAQVIDILNGDPGFAELELERLDLADQTSFRNAVAAFDTLSSGHKVVLLTATRLVELVDEKTLVLIDEPESHLHPPLLGSFVRALSYLLIHRNGVSIIATHSPVVLQEAPKSCVWVLRRTGEVLSAERPEVETFAENVGILTAEVFQLEVTESGHHRMLREAAETMTYDELIGAFRGQIGGEGRAIARTLTLRNRD